MLKFRTLAVAAAAALAVVGTTGTAGAGDTGNVRKDEESLRILEIRGMQDVRGHLKSRDDRAMWASGVFAPTEGATVPKAVTYNPELVPAGAAIAVSQITDGQGMSIKLMVRGLRKDRDYGAHVHTGACGVRPEASGPHYQNVKSPQAQLTDPRYANPENEVWLDLRTDESGAGTKTSAHGWHFRPGEARSVVLHEHHTHRHAGAAGGAGPRLACFTVPFHPAASK
ncbi:MAG TPA: superoxide dismutase family protein [Streptomyces sp.]|nr:superoxide dismutase family protein [Streptomyces sp.]